MRQRMCLLHLIAPKGEMLHPTAWDSLQWMIDKEGHLTRAYATPDRRALASRG